MAKSIILMADVINSRKDNKKVAAILKTLVATVNKKKKAGIISPLTITLGDEFQAIVTDVHAGIGIILFIEELCLEQETSIKLRYVLISGEIETPINRKIAYGMLGEGLTKARETINYLKKSEDRFHLFTSQNNNSLNKLFILYQCIADDWRQKDYKIISDFIRLNDYKLVAEENYKPASQMWKKRKSLKIKEYKVVKSLIIEQNGLD
jgi:hypothetical protein